MNRTKITLWEQRINATIDFVMKSGINKSYVFENILKTEH